MPSVTLDFLSEQLELGEQLLAGQKKMFEPQDLPGRYGRVVAAIDRVLAATSCPAVLGGGWAVWRYGFFGRVTQDIDIVLPADLIAEFTRAAALLGFEVLTPPAGRWPKVRHKETDVTVDILPEGAFPVRSNTRRRRPFRIRVNWARLWPGCYTFRCPTW